MRFCPKCFTNNSDKKMNCRNCGEPLSEISIKENRETIWKWRKKNLLKSHLLTGFFLWFAWFFFIYFPGSLHPITIGLNLIYSLFFGVPLAFLISKYAQSIWGGALIGAVLGVLFCSVFLFFGYDTVQLTPITIAIGISVGVIPGGIMGWHVSMDEDLS